MDREVLALYQWGVGDCFRCAKSGAATTPLGCIDTPIGDRYEIRACEACLLQLEDEKRRAAARAGLTYRPGRLGCNEP